MDLIVKVHAGTGRHEHKLSFPAKVLPIKANQGSLAILLNDEPVEVDWVEVSPGTYSLLLGGRSYEVHVKRLPRQPGSQAGTYELDVGSAHYAVEVVDPRRERRRSLTLGPEGPQEVLAPMPGKIAKLLVSENQEVNSGDGLLVIEAMKMQNELRAPRPGRVEKVYVKEGAGVEAGFKLLRLT